MERHLVEARLRGRADRRQAQHHNDVPAHTVVLPHRFRVVDAAIDAGRVVLSEADDGLQHEDDVGD